MVIVKVTIIAPRVAIDNSTKVKNIILMGTVALSTRENTHNLDVTLPSEYATQVLDKNHTGIDINTANSKGSCVKELFRATFCFAY